LSNRLETLETAGSRLEFCLSQIAHLYSATAPRHRSFCVMATHALFFFALTSASRLTSLVYVFFFRLTENSGS